MVVNRGMTTALVVPTINSTTNISSSVKPLVGLKIRLFACRIRCGLGQEADIGVESFAPRLTVGPIAEQINRVPRRRVLIRVAPRIVWQRFREVRALPLAGRALVLG